MLQTLSVLNLGVFSVSPEATQNGLLKVTENTGIRGRWEILETAPKIICDTAHNREGLSLVFKQLQTEKFQRLHLVLGMVNDKDVTSLLELFPKQAQYYFCKPNVPRGFEASKLAQIFKEHGFQGLVYPSVKAALNAAKQSASQEDLIYIGGSTFVVAEII